MAESPGTQLAAKVSEASALPVCVFVDDSAVVITGHFESGDDAISSAMGLIGEESKLRLREVELSDPTEVAGGTWAQAAYAGVPIFRGGFLLEALEA